jgi:branched-chain amino acid transport system permease protein
MKRQRPGLFGLSFGAVLAGLVLAPHVIGTFQRVLLTEILIWGLFAMAFDLVYGYTGMLSFGQSTYFGFGSYALTLSILHGGIGLWPALLLGIVVAAIMAAVIGFVAVRIRGHYFVIITVIFSLVFFFWAINWTWLTGGDDGLTLKVPDLPLGWWTASLYDPMTNYYFVLVFCAATFLLCRRIVHSPLGKILISIRENEHRARLIGYHVERFKLLIFVIAGGLSGLAGALYSLTFRYANAGLMHWTVSGDAVVWTLVGGTGTLVGPIVGTALLVTFTDYVSAAFENYKIIIGALIVMVVLMAPQGIAGVVQQRWALRRASSDGR